MMLFEYLKDFVKILCRFLLAALGGVFACGTSSVVAAITPNMTSLTGHSGTLVSPYYVIDSDSANANAGYDRDVIQGGASVQFTKPVDFSSDSGTYRLSAQLIGPAGSPVLLAGGGNSVFSASTLVSFTTLQTSQTRSFALDIDPNVDLGAGLAYKIRYTVQKQTMVGPFLTWTTSGGAGPDDTTVFTVVHFTDLPENTANRNARGWLTGAPTWTKVFAVGSGPAIQKRFAATVPYSLARYDLGGVALSIGVRYTAILTDDTGAVIPLEGGGVVLSSLTRSAYSVGTPNAPYRINGTRTIYATPLSQLDPVNRTYKLSVRFEHLETTPSTYRDNGTSPESPLTRLLHFNGSLSFGSLAAAFDTISNSPVAGSPGAGYVNTTLNVSSGTIPGFPNYSFGAGADMAVRLENDGDAVLTSGSRPVIVADGADVEAAYGGITVSYPNTTLDASGAFAGSTVVHLPQGLGYTPYRSSSAGRYLAEITLPGRSLGNTFRHAGTASMATPADAWVFDEARPLLYQVSDFNLDQSGGMHFVSQDVEWAHQAAFDQLDANQAAGYHQQAVMQYRMSNDGYLRFAKISSPRTMDFALHADGSVRTQTAEVDIDPGQFITHFPVNSEVGWNGPGVIKIQDGSIRDDSLLSGVNPMNVKFDGSCAGDECGPPPGTAVDSVTLTPVNNEIFFTSDGGVYAPSSMPAKSLQWGIRGDGTAAHRTDDFTAADFMASGDQMYETDNPLASSGPLASTAALLSPASVLLAGYDRPSHASPVYPGRAEYADGDGSYAGATMVVPNGGALGASRLADMATDYPYTLQAAVSKYYVRPSGISGRHVAEDGSFNGSAVMYGYNFGITRFQLTYLSNENLQSWINGQVEVPYPSGFTQAFEELKLTCTGALAEPQIDPNDAGSKPLAYWNGSFTPMAMRFAPKAGGSCDGPRFLTLGLISGAANINTPLAGSLAFMSSGNIGTLTDDIVAADCRLGLPATLPMNGPGNEKYQLTPVSKLYFNDALASGAPESGYVGFGSRCNVPFFEDLKVHVMTSAQAGIPAAIYLTKGWSESGNTFFSNTKFDQDHRGFPPTAVTVEDYRNPSVQNAYVPVASQSLFGLVPLSYPLKWSKSGRYFTSWDAVTNDLLVVNVEHQVDYLSAENAEISFGAQYDGLPEINLVSAAVDAADAQIGAANALTNAASSFVTDTLNGGVDAVGDLAGDTLEALLDKALDSLANGVIKSLDAAVRDSYDDAVTANLTYDQWVSGSAGNLKSKFDTYLDGANSVKARLKQLHNSAEEGVNLLAEVEDALNQGILAIDSVTSRIEVINDAVVFNDPAPTVPSVPGAELISGLLAKVNNPATGQLERRIVQSLVGQLIHDLALPDLANLLTSASGELNADINAELNALLVDFDPTLERITETLQQSRAYLVQIRAELANGQKIFTDFQQIIGQADAEIDGIVAGMRATAYGFIDQIATAATYTPTRVLGSAGNLMDEFSEQEFVTLLRNDLRDRLLAAGFIQQFQFTLRQYISEIDMAMRSGIDSAFAEVSRMCKELIKESLGPIDDTINGLLGDMDSYVGAGSIDGYARIQNDTLRCLRLDAEVQLKIPEDMELQAYFEMNCYDSASDVGSAGCLAAGEQAVEVKIGALDVPLDWVSPDMRANLEVRFSMQTLPTVRPKGIGGSLDMTGGELDFQGLKVTKFAANVAVGSDECYLAASAAVFVSGYEAAGGIFFGRTCSIEPLEMVDTDAASLLGNPPFTGAYVYGEVWIPISEVVLGVPASCLFRISAGVGAGAFYFVEGPTFGGRMLLGVSGEALCVVSIRGDVSMTGVMTGGSLRFSGRGNLSGKAGYCPFCVKFKESAKVTYQDGDWSVDF